MKSLKGTFAKNELSLSKMKASIVICGSFSMHTLSRRVGERRSLVQPKQAIHEAKRANMSMLEDPFFALLFAMLHRSNGIYRFVANLDSANATQ